jgi:two-component system sensor histidine kinase KdpD
MTEPRHPHHRLALGTADWSSAGPAALEEVGSVALATLVVAALQVKAPAAGLGAVYLLAVLEVAIRRGELAALSAAVLSVLTLNYLFITPRHRLAIAQTQDVVELIVFLIAALVVGKLASVGRERAAEAESRARFAAAREREAALLAESASAILAGQSLSAQLENIGARVAHATGAGHARVVLEPVPSPDSHEHAIRLTARARRVWLYVADDAGWDSDQLQRLADPLGRLIDVAVERELIAERAAETEAARRAETARTAVLHTISHDLRSPLTAITTAASGLGATAVTEAERAELIDVIEVEGARLAKLVDDLLDVSKIEAGAVAPQADWCDLHDVVASAVAHLRTPHPIEFEVPPDLPLVRADAAQLERVFSNLIENAVKFSPPQLPIRLTGAGAAGRVSDQSRGARCRRVPAAGRPRARSGPARRAGNRGVPGGAGLEPPADPRALGRGRRA